MSIGASLVRRSIDELLALHPQLDLVSIDWQVGLRDYQGPWVLVELGQRSDTFDTYAAWAIWKFAIWKRTGAVHTLDAAGAVIDPPIYTPDPQ